MRQPQVRLFYPHTPTAVWVKRNFAILGLHLYQNVKMIMEEGWINVFSPLVVWRWEYSKGVDLKKYN
ncbi:hypothetical protein D0T87_10790 [Bacteroides sp. 51]|nr:hypothetical protein [Bacteroides sp. 51]